MFVCLKDYYGPVSLILILLIVINIYEYFGLGRLPELVTGLGKSIREFKKAMQQGLRHNGFSIEKRKESLIRAARTI